MQAIHAIACNRSATAPALLSTAVPDAVLPHPSMDAYLLHPCSRPALQAYRPSMATPAIAPALQVYRPSMDIKRAAGFAGRPGSPTLANYLFAITA